MMQKKDNLITELETKWRKLCRTVQNEKSQAQIFALLSESYSEPPRAYHNLNHIKALLNLCAEFESKIENSEAVALAVWFHDAVYNPQKGDNEERSAELAVESLRKLETLEPQIETVRQMILATKTHDGDLLARDGKLFLDFDLSVLGADAADYRQYAAAIRREYAFVPEILYRSGRRNILEKFLKRDFIYLTDECRERFEARARQNIALEIEHLSF